MSGVSKVPASQAKVSAAPQPSRRLSRRENTKPKRGGTTTKKPSRTRKLFIFWTISSTVLFAVTSWFAGSTFSTRPGNQVNHILQYYFRISFGKTVAVLRVLQGITSACTSIAVSSSFETVQWELVNRREGLGLLNILSLSPATGAFGVFQLIFGRKENVGNRLCAILRITLVVILFAASLVLFINTSVITAYHPNTTLDVVAGTGKFNGSYVESFLQSFNNTVPFWALASAYSFIGNSFFSIPSNPVNCPKDDRQCNSYLLPGGTYLMYPQLSPSQSSNTVVSIYNASATQLDFSHGLASPDKFSAQDCTVYGDENSYVVVKFCLAQSQVMAGALIAEVSACTNGTAAGECLTTTPGFAPNISTTLAVYNRQATTVCSSTNNSILSVSDLGVPVMNPSMNITDLHLAVGWLLNYSAAGIPPESSINFMFWFDPSSSYESVWETNAYNTLQSLLGFVIWEFSENNNGNPAVSDPEAKGQMPGLPQEFHTQASICDTYLRFVINFKMFIVYVVLEGVVVMLCWVIVGWHISRRGKEMLPNISSYPMVDFASKMELRGEGGGEWNLRLSEKISLKEGDKTIRDVLAGVVMRVPNTIALS